jgi:hypothetical protein
VKLSIREAFALEPTRDVRIGDRTYTVPPLTFGRFQDMIRCRLTAAMECIGAADLGSLGEAVTNLETIAAMAAVDVQPLFPLARTVVPGLVESDWQKATLLDVITLFAHFTLVHDWAFVAEETGILKPDTSAGPSAPEFEGALLLIARELGCRLDEPLNFRLEGFFVAVTAIRAKRRMEDEAREKDQREAEGWDGPRPAAEVLPVQKNPAAAASLDKLIADAEARAGESANG